jgi:hypothetical protein
VGLRQQQNLCPKKARRQISTETDRHQQHEALTRERTDFSFDISTCAWRREMSIRSSMVKCLPPTQMALPCFVEAGREMAASDARRLSRLLAVDDFRPVALACSFIKVCSWIGAVLAIGDSVNPMETGTTVHRGMRVKRQTAACAAPHAHQHWKERIRLTGRSETTMGRLAALTDLHLECGH